MKLYHGTSYQNMDRILKNGIIPRTNINGNWEEHPSRDGHVYLTTSYPFYFAYVAAANKDAAISVVFEIDTDRLDYNNFYPDEDFIYEVVKKEHPEILHKDIKDNLEDYKYNWEVSLRHLGNCSYEGKIPLTSISRYCIVDYKKRAVLAMQIMDPSISILNYKYRGEYYRNLVSWFFGDRKEHPQLTEAKSPDDFVINMEMRQKKIDFWKEQSENRDGIKVIKI